jgi:general L-amino acid transport system permease protein
MTTPGEPSGGSQPTPPNPTPLNPAPLNPMPKPPLWRDERFWKIFLQILALVLVGTVIAIALTNMNRNLAKQGRSFEFGFLANAAGFNIGEAIVPFSRDSTYFWAFTVGLINSIRLILISIPLATFFGVFAGIASFSDNWLLRKLSLLYVEVMRNIPILLVLFIWYFVVFFGLSEGAEVNQWAGLLSLSKKGIWIPWPAGANAGLWAVGLGALAIASIFLWRYRTRIMTEQAASGQPQLYGLLAMGAVGLLILGLGLGWQVPQVSGKDVSGGLKASLEYSAMLMALAAHAGAFIAEVVRAGIQSVSRGQWEAARAMGLSQGHVMRLVVLPQSLRVIVPSLNSQYISLNKNSSLALAIGYPEIFSVSQTSLNQTGRAVEILILLTIVFLLLNFLTSFIMNWINGLVQIDER